MTRRAGTGEVEEVTLKLVNHDIRPIVLTPADGAVHVVAEFLEVVG